MRWHIPENRDSVRVSKGRNGGVGDRLEDGTLLAIRNLHDEGGAASGGCRSCWRSSSARGGRRHEETGCRKQYPPGSRRVGSLGTRSRTLHGAVGEEDEQ